MEKKEKLNILNELVLDEKSYQAGHKDGKNRQKRETPVVYRRKIIKKIDKKSFEKGMKYALARFKEKYHEVVGIIEKSGIPKKDIVLANYIVSKFKMSLRKLKT